MKSTLQLIAILAVITVVLFSVGQGSKSMTNTWLKKAGISEITTEKVVKE